MKRTSAFLMLACLALAQDSQRLPPGEVTITIEGSHRFIRSNGIPDHTPGDFPRRGNPNRISPQRHEYRVTLKPVAAAKPTPSRHASFGVALNGIPFEMGTAEYWDFDPGSGWNYDAMSGKLNLGLDEHHAHVQPTGSYHYHGTPTGLIQKLGGDGQHMLLLGYAADGFPIYSAYAHRDPKDAQSPLQKMRSSYQLRQGTRPSGPRGNYDGTFAQDYEFIPGSGDLDECNGRTGVTPEHPQGTYHYCLTEEFPQLARQWRGTPDPSFEKRGPPGGPGGPGGMKGRRKGGPGLLPPGFPLPPPR